MIQALARITKYTPTKPMDKSAPLTDSVPGRATWGAKIEFLLSSVGYAVGMGNLWRFPYLCMRNGGGAFLIPYSVGLLLCGFPMFYLENYIGQFSSRGVTKSWNICPLFKGIAYGTMIYAANINYYDVLLTWVLYYLWNSFTFDLPWSSCDNAWNTPQCVDRSVNNTYKNAEAAVNGYLNMSGSTISYLNRTASGGVENSNKVGEISSPGKEFFERNMLELTSGIDTLGGFKWDVTAFYLLTFIILFGCMFKGVQSVGKVVYFTATAPYVLLAILLVRGVTLPGAMEGIKYFLMPDFKKLLDPRVWVEANIQVIFSLGISEGLITMASYNKFNNKFYKDVMFIPIVNCSTSILGGCVIFSVVGFMAKQAGVGVDEVIKSGPALAFIAYPEALSKMPFAPLWSVLFFLTLVTVAIDTVMVTVEAIMTGLEDRFPRLRSHKTLFTASVLFVLFLTGLPSTTRGGMYVFQLVDWYASCICLMLFALIECVVVAWVYGHERFYYDIECMTGSRPSLWWKICLCCITPTLLLCSLIYVLTSMSRPYYGNYRYPDFAVAIGWMIASASLVPLPICAAYTMWKAEGTMLERFYKALRPSEEWGPVNKEDRIKYKYATDYCSPDLLLHDVTIKAET